MPGMIVAPQPAAVEEGAKVLAAGGNAVDAAVTCAFVQFIVDPHNCGVGGYALLNAHLVDQPEANLVLDGPALAGSKVTAEMWQDRVIGPNPDGWGFFLRDKVNDSGYQSICTPGAVKTLAAMLERWGTISWRQALEPAARIAEEGFIVSSHLAAGWMSKAAHPEGCAPLDYIRANAEARRIYLKPDGTPYEAGERLRNPDYARTLLQLAQRGPDDLYHGDLARWISDDLAAHGSFVTADDLSGYAVRDEPPVTGDYRGFGISSSPPPHGGPTLLAALNILEGYDLAALGHNSPEYIYRVSMAMKAAFADRNPSLGDPAFVSVPLDWMISKERAATWRDRIDAGEPITVAFTPAESPDTTHVTVVDGRGNAVSLSHSLGSSSGVITPGLGFMFNNSMINFHPYPGHPNSIAPRKGRTTGMAPTLVYGRVHHGDTETRRGSGDAVGGAPTSAVTPGPSSDHSIAPDHSSVSPCLRGEKPLLVLGAPGATRIITACLQVILNVLDFGMSVSDAVLAPRFDCQGDLIRCQARIPEYVCAAVRRRHPIERLPQSHGGLALVHAIGIDPATGRRSGGADTGSGGMALEV